MVETGPLSHPIILNAVAGVEGTEHGGDSLGGLNRSPGRSRKCVVVAASSSLCTPGLFPEKA